MTDTLPAEQTAACDGSVEPTRHYVLEIVIPVHNEEHDLPACL